MRPSLIGAFLALATLPALAQTPEGTPTRIRGTVEGVEGQTVMLKSTAGQDVPVTMAADARVTGVAKRSLSDINAGDAIASTSVRGSDGKLHALELHFLPPGANEGQFPTDLAPGSLMTNAAVAGIAAAPQGRRCG